MSVFLLSFYDIHTYRSFTFPRRFNNTHRLLYARLLRNCSASDIDGLHLFITSRMTANSDTVCFIAEPTKIWFWFSSEDYRNCSVL